MDKTIRCVWVRETEWGYGKAMRVVDSEHPRFVIGSRFDFGFLDIASTEGYRIIIEPVSPALRHMMQESKRNALLS